MPNENLMVRFSDAFVQPDGTPVITLKAVYSDAPQSTSILLFSNNESDTYQETKLKNNASFTIPTITFLGYVRDGYIFTGWNTNPDGTGKRYDEGDVIAVDTGDPLPNAFYAQWGKNPQEEQNSAAKPNTSSVPQTGDSTNIGVYSLLLFASVALLVIMLAQRRHKKSEH